MYRKEIHVTSHREGDIINITDAIGTAIRESGIKDGVAHLFVQHSTAALTTIEYEPGVLSDLRRALSVLAPNSADYAHNARWGDGNGRSHVKGSLVGPSLTVPIKESELTLGTWQQIVLLELDTQAPRSREITCTAMGDKKS